MQPVLTVPDLSLPGMEELEDLLQARAAKLNTPFMILTACGTVIDRIPGLNAGADDCLAQPFDPDELDAWVRALHWHPSASPHRRGDRPQWGQLRYDRGPGGANRHSPG